MKENHTAPVRTRLHWSTDSRPAWAGGKEGPLLWTGVAVWPANKTKLDKGCSPYTYTSLPGADTHTSLSTGLTNGLSLWLPSCQSAPRKRVPTLTSSLPWLLHVCRNKLAKQIRAMYVFGVQEFVANYCINSKCIRKTWYSGITKMSILFFIYFSF